MFRGVLLLVFVLGYFLVSAGELKKVIRAYEKQDWVKTEEIIRKALSEAPVNPGIRYYYSLFYAQSTFPRMNMDSARIQIRWSIEDLKNASSDLIEEMAKEDLDSVQLYDQLAVVREYFFTVSKEEMTVNRWQQFIDWFGDAPRIDWAKDTRDSLALESTKLDGSIDAWKQFLASYPDSKYKTLVINKRDSLIVSGHIVHHNEKHLIEYAAQHPNTAITDMALGHLLKLTTLSGSTSSFLTFINNYKTQRAASRAVNWLFHLDREQDFVFFDQYKDVHVQSDSLRLAKASGYDFYFPVYDNGFELVSATKENKTLALTKLSEDIRCNGWTQDFIDGELDGKPVVLARNGNKIANGRLIADLGKGLLLIESAGVRTIYHKTGEVIVTGVQEAALLEGRLIKVKKEKWGLVSLMGIALTDYRYDDIFVDGHFWFFRQDGLLATAAFDKLIDAFPEGLYLEFKFEDYEMISPDELIGFRDDRECLMKSDGSFRVPWGKHQIYPSDSLGFIHDDKGFALYGHLQYSYFPYMEANAGFVLAKTADKQWSLTSNRAKWTKTQSDSIRLLNPYFALSVGAERKLLFHSNGEMVLKSGHQPFVFSPLSKYLLLKDKVSHVVDDEGKLVFSGNFDEIRLLGDTLFSVSFKKKYGLISATGRELLPMKFEYIDSRDGMVSVLLNGKIGALDLTRNIRFEPTLESKPERIGKYYKVMKSGKYGLLDSLQREVVPFQFDGLSWWTDQRVWVQLGEQFSLMDLTTSESQMVVTRLSPLSPDGDLYKFYGSIGFGIISRTMGVIVPAEFTEIRLMGTSQSGVLMAEQALPEAGFVVVTYYTLAGEKIYSHAYRRSDYEKVFCDD
jgi:hypothetical protein